MTGASKKSTHTAAEVAALESKIQQQQTEINLLRKKLDHMNEVLANVQRTRFGQSSEKTTYVLNEEQITLFNEAEMAQNIEAPEPTEETLTVAAHSRKKKRTIDELTADLPVEEVILDLPEDRLTCDKCGGTFTMIGKKFVSQQLIIVPRQYKLVKYFTCSYACKKCEKYTGYARIISTVAPPQVDEALSGVALHRGRHHDQKMCGWSAFGTAGKDFEA